MKRMAAILATSALLVAGCNDDNRTTAPDGTAIFEVEVQGQTFTVRAEDQAAIDALEARLDAGAEGVVLGSLAAGDGGFNEPWSWHLVPGTIEVPDAAIEVCDGTPSMVEENLDYWLNTVGQYCPWSAEVVRRVD